MSIGNFLEDAVRSTGRFVGRHWKKLAGAGIAVAGAFVPGLQPLVPLGTLLLGSDFQLGGQIGTPLGAGAKRVADAHDKLQAAKLEIGEVGRLVERLRALGASENSAERHPE